MTPAQALKVLGLAAGADAAAVRKAYADRLRAIDPDADVAGFSRLRQARDTALAAARHGSRSADPLPQPLQPEAEPETDRSPEPDVAAAEQPAERKLWIHAAPQLDLAAVSGVPTAAPVPWPGGPLARMPWLDVGSGSVVDLPASAGWAFGVPQLTRSDIDPATCVVAGRRYDAMLHALLYPQKGEQDAAMSHDEASQAQACLKALLADARNGSLAAHDAIEGWLARNLAGAWPRSAPLVEPAAQAFGWEREAGRLGERAEIAFLNARRDGMQFHEAVLEPSHPYHKAWRELQRPGRPGTFSRWWASQRDVHALIDEVRRKFPELEHFWDPQRVAARERLSSQPGTSSGGGPGRFFWVFLVIAAVRLIAAMADSGSSGNAPNQFSDLLKSDAVVAEAFGPDHDMAWLRQKQPLLAQQLDLELSGSGKDETPAQSGEYFADRIRPWVLASARKLGGADLDKVMRLRLDLGEAARDTPACLNLIRSDQLVSGVTLPPELRKAEQGYAATLAEADMLAPPAGRRAQQVSIPGPLMVKALAASYLDRATFEQALRGKGRDSDQCDAWLSLLRETLKYHGTGREELLLFL